MMPSHGVAFSLIFVLFLAQNAIEATSIYVNVSDQEPMMVPLMGLGEKMETAVVMSGGRRRLRSFQSKLLHQSEASGWSAAKTWQSFVEAHPAT
ncbi:uncharacterized protein LOC111018147 isoform X2 [Momordica charantia]|uniref:Uncharacterized protein LOC111018147 isoform X2 n=1 Tax=Momordica charantia TaxID=3673 RepID=A0A6J1D900_MOMCH|nr:uncharacterized protein LOC111018147 isoform X2 [Momordica charantia]